MKIYENILSKDLFEECLRELNSLVLLDVWNNSEFRWGKDVQTGFVGVINATSVSENLSIKLWEELKHYLGEYGGEIDEHGNKIDTNEIGFQFYIWNKGSAIPEHTDHQYTFGASIYLNHEWSSSWGGLFVWQEGSSNIDKDRELHALCPKKNLMVVNNLKEPHLVTIISPIAPEPRISIQIWGKVSSSCCDATPHPEQWTSHKPRNIYLGDRH